MRDRDPVSGRHDGAILVPIFSPHSGSKMDYEVERKGFKFEVFISRIQHSKLRRYCSRGNFVLVPSEGKLSREGPKSLKMGFKLYWVVRELDQGRSG